MMNLRKTRKQIISKKKTMKTVPALFRFIAFLLFIIFFNTQVYGIEKSMAEGILDSTIHGFKEKGNYVSGNWLYRLNEEGYAEVISYTDPSIQSISIPTQIDGYWIIGLVENAFSECDALQSVMIPSIIFNIPNSAFPNHDHLSIKGYNGTAAMTFAALNNLSYTNLSKLDFFDDILDLGEIQTDQWVLGESSLTISEPYGLQLQAGNKIFLPSNGNYNKGVPVQIEKIEHKAGLCTAQVHQLDFMETVSSYHIKSEQVYFDYENIEILCNGVSKASNNVMRKARCIEMPENLLTLEIPLSHGWKIKGTLGVTAAEGNIDVNYENYHIDDVIFDGKLTLVPKISIELESEKNYNKKWGKQGTTSVSAPERFSKLLARLPFSTSALVGGYLNLYLVASVEGSVSFEAAFTFNAHAAYHAGSGVTGQANLENVDFTTEYAIEGKLGVNITLDARLGFFLITPYIDASVKILELDAELDFTIKGEELFFDDGIDLPCIDLSCSLDLTCYLRAGIINNKWSKSSYIDLMMKDLSKENEQNPFPNLYAEIQLLNQSFPIYSRHWEASEQKWTESCHRRGRQYQADFDFMYDDKHEIITAYENEWFVAPYVAERDSYTFAGWYIDTNFETKWDPYRRVHENITVYAKWEETIEGTWYALTYRPDFHEDGQIDNSGTAARITKIDLESVDDYRKEGYKLFHGDSLDINVPAFVNGTPVTAVDYYGFSNCNALRSITLPQTVKTIHQEAFAGCENLIKVNMQDSVTIIEERAFNNCKNLSELRFSRNLKEIQGNAFTGAGIKDVVLPDGLTTLQPGAFTYCNMESVSIPGTVHTIETNTFLGCQNLKKVVLHTGLTNISSYAFYFCPELSEITFPHTLKRIEMYAFGSCSSLKDINFGKVQAEIENKAFWDCTSLEEVVIPSTLKSIDGGTFHSCSSLKEFYCPDNVPMTGLVEFGDCTSLTKIHFPEQYINQISLTNSFQGCINLESVELPENLTTIPAYAFFGCKKLTNIHIPDSVDTIGFRAFEGCESLTTIVLPDKVETIDTLAFAGCGNLRELHLPRNLTEFDYVTALRGCTNLEVLKIWDYADFDNFEFWDWPNTPEPKKVYVESLNGKVATWFKEYYPNTELIPFADNDLWVYFMAGSSSSPDSTALVKYGSTVTAPARPVREGYGFIGWFSDPKATIPWDFSNKITKNITLYAGWGESDSTIYYEVVDNQAYITDYLGEKKDVIIPSEIDGFTVTGLKSGCIPETVRSLTIASTIEDIDPEAFRFAENLEKVSVATGNTVYRTVNNVLYKGNSLILYPAKRAGTVFTIPSGIISIEQNAFRNASLLINLNVSSDVTSLGRNAVSDCDELQEIHFVKDPTFIDEGNFINCSDLLNVSGPVDATCLINYTSAKQVLYNTYPLCLVIDEEPRFIIPVQAGQEINIPDITETDEEVFVGWAEDREGTIMWNNRPMPSEPLVLFAITRPALDYTETEEGIQLTNYLGNQPSVFIPVKIDGKNVVSISEDCFTDKNITLIGERGSIVEEYANNKDMPFMAVKHTITFETYNGSHLDSMAFEATQPLNNLPIPVWKGYTFQYWVDQNSEQIDEMPAEDIILYAYWTRNENEEIEIPVYNKNEYITRKENNELVITGYIGTENDLTIPDTIDGIPVVAIDDSAFEGNPVIQRVQIPDSIKKIGSYAFRDSTIANVNLGKTENISEGAFYGCADLEEVVLPETLTFLGRYAFANCSSLSSISIPDHLLQIQAGTFYHCERLQKIEWSEKLIQIGEMAFYGCLMLQIAVIGADVNFIAPNAFDRCTSLTEFAVVNNPYYKAINGVLFKDTGSTLVRYPEGRTAIAYTIPEQVEEIDEAAFRNSRIETIQMNDNLMVIGEKAFIDSKVLKKVNLNHSLIGIGNNSFEGCATLDEIEIPESVTTIGMEAFARSGLLKITISKNTNIQTDAIPENNLLTIYGVTASPADIYAQEHKIRFVDELVDIPITNLTIPEEMILNVGDRYHFVPVLYPNDTTETNVRWYSSDYQTAIIDASGYLIARKEGAVTITAVAANGTTSECNINIVVKPTYDYDSIDIREADFIIPKTLITIEDEAFAGISAGFVIIPSTCRYIGHKAFSNCQNLIYLYLINGDDIQIEPDVLEGSNLAIICAPKGSKFNP